MMVLRAVLTYSGRIWDPEEKIINEENKYKVGREAIWLLYIMYIVRLNSA